VGEQERESVVVIDGSVTATSEQDEVTRELEVTCEPEEVIREPEEVTCEPEEVTRGPNEITLRPVEITASEPQQHQGDHRALPPDLQSNCSSVHQR